MRRKALAVMNAINSFQYQTKEKYFLKNKY